MQPINAENKESQFVEKAFFNHLMAENLYDNNHIYLMSSPIYINEFRISDDSIEFIKRQNNKIYVLKDNVGVSIAIESDEVIKTFRVVDNEECAIIQTLDIITAIEVNGYICLCSNQKVIAINGIVESELSEVISRYLQLNREFEDEVIFNEINFSNMSLSSGNIIPLPRIGQSPYNSGCWAACMASFNTYYCGVNTSARDVVYQIYGYYPSEVPVKSVSNILYYFQYYFDIMTASRNVNNSNFCTYLRNDISMGKAYILLWYYTTINNTTGVEGNGHFTVLKGYVQQGTIYSYSIMDPNNDGYLHGGEYELTSNSALTFPVNNKIKIGSNTYTGNLSNSIYYGYIIQGTR